MKTLLAQVDVKLTYLYSSHTLFESTLEIYNDEGDMWAILGKGELDITNELPFSTMEEIIEDCK